MAISSVKADVYSAPVLASYPNNVDSNTVKNGNSVGSSADVMVQANETKQLDTYNMAGQKTKDVSKDEIENKVDVLNKFMQSLNPNLQFSLHEKSKQMMVKFVDVKTNEVLKEFPAPAFLDMVADIGNYVGILLDKKL